MTASPRRGRREGPPAGMADGASHLAGARRVCDAADCATFEGKGGKATVPLKLDSRGDESGCGDCAALSAFPSVGVGELDAPTILSPGPGLPGGDTVPHR